MKVRRAVLVLFVAAFGLLALPGAGAMPFFMGMHGGWEASPALAALLSLMPVPVAVGQPPTPGTKGSPRAG